MSLFADPAGRDGVGKLLDRRLDRKVREEAAAFRDRRAFAAESYFFTG